MPNYLCYYTFNFGMKLCSACLLGIKCRYDGKSMLNKKIIALLEKEVLIPVYPEQLGGLPTPREPTYIKGDGVTTTLLKKNGIKVIFKENL